jgi:tRNA(Glu) U13 pseudouridine synthase TruD
MKITWRPPRSSNKRKASDVCVDASTTGSKQAKSKSAVSEQVSEPLHVWFTLLKYNLEQQEASRRLSDAVRVPVGQVCTAGIKDRRALTVQRCSITIHPRDHSLTRSSRSSALLQLQSDLMSLNSAPMGALIREYVSAEEEGKQWFPTREMIGLAVASVEWRNEGVSTGQLWGNQFRIMLRDVRVHEHTEESDDLAPSTTGCSAVSLEKYLHSALVAVSECGFPNYFGSQRMGVLTKHTSECVSDAQSNDVSKIDNVADGVSEGVNGRVQSSMPPGPLIGKYLLTDQAQCAVATIMLGSASTVTLPHSSTATHTCSDVDQARALFSQYFVERRVAFSTDKSVVKARLQSILALLPHSLTRECDLVRNLIRNVPVVVPGGGMTDTVSLMEEFDRQWTQCCERALSSLPYSVRQLWVCAYQSWLWNYMANYTLTYSQKSDSDHTRKTALSVGDVVLSEGEGKGKGKGEPQILTESDIASSTLTGECVSEWSIKDLVLPNIGKHMTYPENEIGLRYLNLLQSEGLIHYPDACASACVSECERVCQCPHSGCTISCRVDRGMAHLFQKNATHASSMGIVPRGSYRRVLVSVCLQ